MYDAKDAWRTSLQLGYWVSKPETNDVSTFPIGYDISHSFMAEMCQENATISEHHQTSLQKIIENNCS